MASTPAWRSGHSPRRIPTLLFFLLASPSVLDLAAAADAPQCFFPDGSVDKDGVVCDVNQAKASGGASGCCSKFDSCYGNGLCLNDWNNATIWYRNSCTDKTFGNAMWLLQWFVKRDAIRRRDATMCKPRSQIGYGVT